MSGMNGRGIAISGLRAAMFLGVCLLASSAGSSHGAAAVDSAAGEAPPGTQRPNHLAGQTSPYLIQHLYNPVDWYPWGDEAIRRARAEQKPIFLSIGYSACHWCHVMERETFLDPEIARILKESFISIKVDREERPDLDDLYMTAVQAMSGSGGWPMSVFLTPDLEPFFGGTYFPRDRFRDLIVSLADAWSKRRPEVLAVAARMRQAIVEMQHPRPTTTSFDPGADMLTPAVAGLKVRFDSVNGGFGGAPKFPPHGALALLLKAHREKGDAAALDMAVRTLEAMARGGIYDQLGGGFHRYSTDAKWRVPHFEKMLYDNALLAPLYLEAWTQTGRLDLRRVGEETLGWALREMADPAGGFYGTLDADSEGEEGRYYVWTRAEIRRALGEHDAGLVIAYYGVTDKGDLPGGKNVLHVAVAPAEFARRHSLSPSQLESRLAAARAKLFKARSARVRPHLDDKVLTAWNGLMISALAEAYSATGEAKYRDAALNAARFAARDLKGTDGHLLVSWRKGRPGLPGHLDDSAFLAQGFLDLHDAVKDRTWVEEASRIVKDADRFFDKSSGGYFLAPAGRTDLFVRTKSLNDDALPSGNAVMVACLSRLAVLERDRAILDPAIRTLNLAAPGMTSSPAAYSYMILAAGEADRAAATAGKEPLAAMEPPAAPAKHEAPAAGVALAASKSEAAGDKAAPVPSSAGTRTLKGTIVGRPSPQKVVDAQLSVPERPIRPGEPVTLSLLLDISPGWHVNSSRPTLKYLIPTKVEFPEAAGLAVEQIAYPEGIMVELEFAKEKLSVFMDKTVIRPTLRPPADAPSGPHALRARVNYQACSDTACLAPETSEFSFTLSIAGEPVAARQDAGRDVDESVTNPIARLLKERGLIFVLGFVFLGGLALNLTPCVYPMIPVTIGFFANQATDGSWRRRVTLPSLYVLGMAVTYSVLGLVAGLSGGMFGAILQSPWVVGSLVLLFVLMALWMFGLFELRLPGALTRFSGGRTGALGALLMGLTMGLVAAPCIGPFIVTLLAFVAAAGQPILGFWLFFVMALGLGLPFLFLGVFSGALSSLPRSGVWLIYAKKVMGLALLAVAIYFLQPLLTDRILGMIVLGFAVASGIYLLVLARAPGQVAGFAPLRLAIALLALGVGLWAGLPLMRARAESRWSPYSSMALQEARDEGRPVIIDFSADWCLPCKELERSTFSDARVRTEMGRFALLQADLTSFESEPVRELRDRFAVVGVPTIVFMDPRGEERADLRLHGFEDPGRFLARLQQVR